MGAWIETFVATQKHAERGVAPYVGAWIETPQFGDTATISQSHPMWVRGLKRCILSDGSKHFEGVPSWN